MTDLSSTDYKKILEYYGLEIPKSERLLKKKAEDILSEKLCSCIKKVDKGSANESKAIAVCTQTIFNKRGLKRGKFTCKKKRGLKITKKSR
jgi:hypothetical protein